jgi:hypothetical protein
VLIDTNVVFDVFDAHQVKICLNLTGSSRVAATVAEK